MQPPKDIPPGVDLLPYGVAIHPAGTFVYVAVSSTDVIAVIAAATKRVFTIVPVGRIPVSVAVHPTGTFAYATSGAGVAVIDTA